MTTGMRENGVPIWAVFSLSPDDNGMQLAVMLERSPTVKRGSAETR